MRGIRLALAITVGLAIPSALYAQPVSAPSAVTYNRVDSLSASRALATPLLPPTASPRSSILTRNVKVGAIAGGVAGIVAAQFMRIGCADNVLVDVRNPEIRIQSRGCSEVRQRLLFSGYSALFYGAFGSAVGLTLRLVELSAGGPETAVAPPPSDTGPQLQNR